MAKVSASNSRIGFSHFEGTLVVDIPARRMWAVVSFLMFWLMAWGFGWVGAASQLLREPSHIFLLGWLGAWTVGGGYAIYSLLWMLFGRETIEVKNQELIHKRSIGPWIRSREFELAEVVKLRQETASARGHSYFLGSSRHSLCFDYGIKTYSFASGIDDAEASHILAAIKRFRE